MTRRTQSLWVHLVTAALGLAAWGGAARAQDATPATQCLGAWGAPTNLNDPALSSCDPADPATCINTGANEFHPAISPDGLSLFITSNRPGGAGLEDVWVSRRASPDAPWGAPRNLGPSVNTGGSEYAPNLSPDGHWLFFTHADRPFGTVGPSEIRAAYRDDVEDDLGWEPAVTVGGDLNDPRFDANAPRVFVDPETESVSIYFNSLLRPGSLDYDEYVSTWWPEIGDAGNARAGRLGRHFLEHATFPVGVSVAALNSPRRDTPTAIRSDGLEMLLTSNRTGAVGGLDLWVSTRASTIDEEWSPPVNLGPVVNGPANDGGPALSADGTTLYLYSERDPGALGGGGRDLYVATRASLCGG